MQNCEMNLQDYLTACAVENRDLSNEETGMMMKAVQGLYEVTGSPFYKECLKKLLSGETEGGVFAGAIDAKRALFFLYEEEKDPGVRQEIEDVNTAVHSLLGESAGMGADGFYRLLPFYMEYETVFHQKENYNDLYFRAADMRKLIGIADGAAPDPAVGYYMMGLLDLYENSSEESFDQHRQYAIWYKEALKVLLTSGAEYSPALKAMLAYTILKGVRLGVLLEEKYRGTGEKLLEEQLAETFKGAVLPAYAEYRKLEAYDIENGLV